MIIRISSSQEGNDKALTVIEGINAAPKIQTSGLFLHYLVKS